VRGAGALSLLLAVFALLLTACGEPPPPRFDNLIIVMIDTLRSDHLASYGYERDTAPFLGELAAEGIQLQGYAASSWTRSSIATLLTGLHPQRHQTTGRRDSLPAGVAYLPELLAQAGFTTAGYAGNMNASGKWGFRRGFASWRQCSPQGKVPARRVTREAMEMLPTLKPPFLLYVHYVDPHDPYRPEVPWGTNDSEERPPYVQPQPLRAAGPPPWDPQDIARMVDQYDGEIREMDREIRRLFEALRERGLLKKTLVVVTADHGEEFAEHGGLTHGVTLYEEVLRVPFLLWSSRGLPHYASEAPFHQVDFLPTVLEALGLGRRIPPRLDGVSRWREVITGASPTPGDLFFHLDLSGRGALALHRPPQKLIHRNAAPHDLLFDLESDPGEAQPLDPATEEAADFTLKRDLLRHHNRLGTLAARRELAAMDDESRHALAALGYLALSTSDEELAARAVPRLLDRERGLAAD
jgi:arylsulfatase A-like enzyme